MDHVEHCNCGTVNAVHILGQHADCEYYDHHCETCHEAGICTATDCTARIDQSVAHWKNETQRQRCRADEAQRDLAASRRESAALGAMVARLREALTEYGDQYEVGVGGKRYARCTVCRSPWAYSIDKIQHSEGCALALTPATVAAELAAMEARHAIGVQMANVVFNCKQGDNWARAKDQLAALQEQWDAARALASDRAPGKGNDK